MSSPSLLLRRLAGLGRLLGASLGLLLLVAGIPLGLVVGVGFPRSVPSWSDIVNQLQTQGIPTAALFYFLALVCWLLWAYLIWCLVTEAGSLVRRSSGRRRGVTGPGQLLAGALLASLFLGLQLMTSRAVPPRSVTPLAAGLAPRTSVTAVYHPAPPATTPGTGASLLASSPSPSADEEVQVQPGDSLWAIAGREYGNPQEWPDIWGANQGQTEGNGQTFTDPSLIDPGWELEVPNPSPPAAAAPAVETPGSSSAATSGAGSSPPALNAEQRVEVQPGDSLWAISGREYGEPQDWTRIWDADQGQTEDNGQTFTDPSLIDPGWDLAVPALDTQSTPASAPTTATPPTPTQTVAPASGAAPHDIRPAPTSLAPSLAPVAPSVPAGGAPASPPTTSRPPAGHTPAVRAAASTDAWVVTLAEAGVLAGITAAALGGLLLAAQRYERWRRRPGDPAGSRVAVLARRPSVARIRAALATATGSAQDGSAPSAPVLALQARLEEIEAVPGRLVVGRGAGDDGDALVDIDKLHRLVLAGAGGRGAARALIVSFLAHHRWFEAQVMVASASRAELISRVDGAPGLRVLRADQVLESLEGEIRYQRSALDGDHMASWRERLGGPDPLPALLAVLPAEAIEASELDLDRLARAVEAARDLAIAVMVVGPIGGAVWADPVEVAVDGTIDAPSAARLAWARTLYTLSRTEADELLAVIGAGRGPDLVPDLTPAEHGSDANPWQGPSLIPEIDAAPVVDAAGPDEPPLAASTPASTSPTAPAPALVIPPALEPRRVDVRIYGPVRVLVDGQELLKALPDAGRQVLALLAIRGELTEDEIVDALGAGSTDQLWRSRFVRGTRGSRPALRQALGDPSIDPLPFHAGVFRLDPELVSSDFQRLLAGRDAALATSVPEHRAALLTRATEGIRGAPFTHADYNWLVDHQEHVRSVAVDTLSQLAELHAVVGDLDKAIETVEQALTLDPDPIEDLFRRQMLWQHRLGRPQQARDVYRQLVRQLSDRCDRTPSEETTALLESLDTSPRVVVQ
jgi:nucleoid-associated protein YgaU/DNA-binding SARP family transcriptional activator